MRISGTVQPIDFLQLDRHQFEHLVYAFFGGGGSGIPWSGLVKLVTTMGWTLLDVARAHGGGRKM